MVKGATLSSSKSEIWAERAKTAGLWLAIAAVAFLIGAYIFAPNQQRAQENYVPVSYAALPSGVVSFAAEDGSSFLLPVRIADTSSARLSGFAGVGPDAMNNQFLLYAQSRQVSARTSYAVDKVRAPLELAVIDGEGNVVSIVTTTAGQERVTIQEAHRWVLAAKSGTFSHYGIEPGLTLDVEAIQKLNL